MEGSPRRWVARRPCRCLCARGWGADNSRRAGAGVVDCAGGHPCSLNRQGWCPVVPRVMSAVHEGPLGLPRPISRGVNPRAETRIDARRKRSTSASVVHLSLRRGYPGMQAAPGPVKSRTRVSRCAPVCPGPRPRLGLRTPLYAHYRHIIGRRLTVGCVNLFAKISRGMERNVRGGERKGPVSILYRKPLWFGYFDGASASFRRAW
jgi:hypothetical protein